MIHHAINTINNYLEGYTKLYCLLERREKKTVEYSGGGSFNEIPFDNFAVGGYWRLRSKVTVSESEGTVACTKKQAMTYPLYFVAWFNRDNVTETIDEFAQNTMALISGLRTPAIKTKIVGFETDKQKDETGKVSDKWVLLRFEVDIIFTKNCPTTCVTPAVNECILNGSINDVAIGQFFSDFNITVVNTDSELVGYWDAENSVWIVPSGEDCPTLCEQVAESTAEEVVECIQDAGLLRQVQDIVCTPEPPCPLGWSVVNSEEDTIITGIVSNPCDEPSLIIPIGDVTYYDCNGDLQTAPYPNVPNTPINEPCPPCEPLTIDFNGIPYEVADPCGAEVPVTCETLLNAIFISGAGSFIDTVVPYDREVNGRPAYSNDVVTVLWDGEGWLISNSEGGRLFYSSDQDVPTPYDVTEWAVGEFGTEPIPTVTQATVADALNCCDCQTLEELLALITADDVMAEVWANLSEAAQNEIIANVCEECKTLCELIDENTSEAIVDCIDDAGKTAEVQALICPVCPDWGCPKLATHTTFVSPHPVTGHIYVYTGLTFGYEIAGTYYDKFGNVTTLALAFPNDLVIPWNQAKFNQIGVISRVINVPISNSNYATRLTNLATLNSGAGYAGYTDWTSPKAQFFAQIADLSLGLPCGDFAPFNNNGTTAANSSTWCQEERVDATTNQYFAELSLGGYGTAAKTQNRGCHIYREFTNAQLGI